VNWRKSLEERNDKTAPAMKVHVILFLGIGLLVLLLVPPIFAEEIKLGTNTVVLFASVEAGRKILTSHDDFVSALSPFDRAARVKTDQTVSEENYLKFVGQNVMPWLPDETNKITDIFQALEGKLAVWHLPFPSTILLIKTSGREEGDASYTRQNAVIICVRDIQSDRSKLSNLVTHELFHILSRQNPLLRRELYHIIGFNPINTVELPEMLRQRKITNPDGVQYNWYINVTNQSRALPVIPILYASTSHYVPTQGGEFFDYLIFKLLAVTNDNAHWEPRLINERPQLLEPVEVRGFFEQIGNNTSYIIHPDEILADNFVLLINGTTNPPTPRIIADMKKVFVEQNLQAR
jgi:hypothetical protein